VIETRVGNRGGLHAYLCSTEYILSELVGVEWEVEERELPSKIFDIFQELCHRPYTSYSVIRLLQHLKHSQQSSLASLNPSRPSLTFLSPLEPSRPFPHLPPSSRQLKSSLNHLPSLILIMHPPRFNPSLLRSSPLSKPILRSTLPPVTPRFASSFSQASQKVRSRAAVPIIAAVLTVNAAVAYSYQSVRFPLSRSHPLRTKLMAC